LFAIVPPFVGGTSAGLPSISVSSVGTRRYLTTRLLSRYAAAKKGRAGLRPRSLTARVLTVAASKALVACHHDYPALAFVMSTERPSLGLPLAVRLGEELGRPRRATPYTIFRRALEHDNLVLAEVTAREIGQTDRGLKRLWNFGARSGIVT
jgi:hypothetical protein